MDNQNQRVTEQATDEQSNVLPPFAAPASQHDARDPNWLLSTMDGKDWADEFCRLNTAADHGAMLGWFCNAIMTGYDTGRRHEAEEQARTAGAAKGGNTNANSSESLAAQAAHAGADTERDAARYRFIEEHATMYGGGNGFTITCFVGADEEDMGVGIDAAIAASQPQKGSQA